MNRREQLLDLLVARTSASRERLQRESTDELERILDRSLLKGIRDEAMNSPEAVQRQRESEQRIAEIQADSQQMAQEQAFASIFRFPIYGKVAIDNQANRTVLIGWLQEDQGEKLSSTWFAKVLREQPQLARSLAWQSADILDPKKRQQAAIAQEADDRETFETTAKRSELYSINEANWNVLYSTLGLGLNEYQIQQAIHSGAVRLSPATAEEIQQWRYEAAEERQDYLRNQASPLELRAAARQESEQGRAQQQRTAQQVKIREQKESAVGYHPLPEVGPDGQKWDRAYLLRLASTDIQQYKHLCSYHGFAEITARLNGVR